MTTTRWANETQVAGQHATVNGVELYHEVHGTGQPLVLLHGGLASSEMFGPVLPLLAEHHQVIAVDLQGHGRTADVDRPLDMALVADDVAALVEHLGHEQVDVVGYSFGGGVALQIAVRHPQVVRKLVMCSAFVRRDAIYADMLAQQEQMGAAMA